MSLKHVVSCSGGKDSTATSMESAIRAAEATSCPYTKGKPNCYPKICIMWAYVAPLPELDADKNVVLRGEAWKCGLDEEKRLVAGEGM